MQTKQSSANPKSGDSVTALKVTSSALTDGRGSRSNSPATATIIHRHCPGRRVRKGRKNML